MNVMIGNGLKMLMQQVTPMELHYSLERNLAVGFVQNIGNEKVISYFAGSALSSYFLVEPAAIGGIFMEYMLEEGIMMLRLKQRSF